MNTQELFDAATKAAEQAKLFGMGAEDNPYAEALAEHAFWAGYITGYRAAKAES